MLLGESSKANYIFTALALLLVILSLFGSLFGIMHLYSNKPSLLASEKIILLKKGTPLKQFAQDLADQNIIEHPTLFWIYLELAKRSKPIQAGEYAFAAYVTPRQITYMLSNGKFLLHRITIPEGMTNKQIIAKLYQEPALAGEIDQEISEGHLLPDTYFFLYGDQRQGLIHTMNKKMTQALDELWEKRASNLPFATKEEALTLASIIEKETSLEAERKIVAGVFVNRLRKNMKLQADPTTIYAITKGSGDLGRELTKKDLLTQSPFNTYVAAGLPPHPIANPGIASIEAALNPANTTALFFVVTGSGGHNFASNLTEHSKNVQKYRTLNKP